MRAIGRFLSELAAVYVAGLFGFFLILVLVAGAVLVWLIGCVSGLFLLIALAETAWWLHTHGHHAAVTALGYYGYAAGTFALILVLFFIKDELVCWPQHRNQNVAEQRIFASRMPYHVQTGESAMKCPVVALGRQLARRQ